MADLLFVGMLIAFFALSVLFVRACERILGEDDAAVVELTTEEDAKAAA